MNSRYEYKEGDLEGPWTEWYPNGQKRAEGQLTEVSRKAVEQAVKAWHGTDGKLGKEIASAIARLASQENFRGWAAGLAAIVEGEVDAKGLIDTAVLSETTFNRAHRKNEKPGTYRTNAYECLDAEFVAYIVDNLGEKGLTALNRLRFRLLLLAAVEWAADLEKHHWAVEG